MQGSGLPTELEPKAKFLNFGPIYIWGWKIPCCGIYLGFYKMFGSIHNHHSLYAKNVLKHTHTHCCEYQKKNVSRHCQIFPPGQNHPWWRATDLEGWSWKFPFLLHIWNCMNKSLAETQSQHHGVLLSLVFFYILSNKLMCGERDKGRKVCMCVGVGGVSPLFLVYVSLFV